MASKLLRKLGTSMRQGLVPQHIYEDAFFSWEKGYKFQMKWTVLTWSCFTLFIFKHITFLETNFYFKFYSTFVYLKNVSVLKHHGAGLSDLCYKNTFKTVIFPGVLVNYLTPGLWVRVEYSFNKTKNPIYFVFVDFHEIQISIIIHFKLLTWYHWMYRWKICTVGCLNLCEWHWVWLSTIEAIRYL